MTDLYNVANYTDTELYNLLDLNHPTDRELEAKLHFLIYKYKNMESPDAERLTTFFEDIYEHFFETSDNEEEVVEGYTDMTMTYAKQAEAQGNISGNGFSTGAGQGNTSTGGVAYPNLNTSTPKTPPADAAQTITYNKSLDYVPDKLNPILKPTTTRIVVIDSQYRDDKSTFSTEFTFNLSEPLKDVVALKLSYVNIPFSWYTVSKSYGSNFYFLKGSSGGIANGNHDILFSVAPGNYSAIDLKNTLNQSIQTAKQTYTDVSFGTTQVNYNSFTGLASLTFDVSNVYTENSFDVSFSNWRTPNDVSSNRVTSIPSYLGFANPYYSTNSIRSPFFLTSTYNIATDTNNNYLLTSANNFMRVIKYLPTINTDYILPAYVDCSNNPNILDISFSITLSLALGNKYTRNQILTNLQQQIQNTPQLSTESYIQIISVNPANKLANQYFELKLKPNRYTTQNIPNSKLAIYFPTETGSSYNIWTGDATSCFGFQSTYNEMNDIVGELPSIPENSIFTISTSPYILLRCNTSGFITYGNTNYGSTYNNLNDISFALPNAVYTSTAAYVKAINTSISNAVKKNTITNAITGSTVLNAENPNTYIYSITSTTPPTGTWAYIDAANKFNLFVDITYPFTQSMYRMNISGFLGSQLVINSPTTTLLDLTQTYSSTSTVPSGIYIISTGSTIASISPRYTVSDLSRNGNEGDFGYTIQNTGADIVCNSFQDIATNITNLFTNYVDTQTSRNIFTGTTLTFTQDAATGNATFTLTVKINKILTATNYTAQFIDTTKISNYAINSWNTNLKVDASMCSVPFDMSAGNPFSAVNSNTILTKTTFNEVTLTAYDTLVSTNLLTVTTGNNTISFLAYEDGVKDTTGTNNIILTIPMGTYSIDTLLTAINTQIATATSGLTSILGTYFSSFTNNSNTYIKIRTNLSRVYTAQDYNLVFYDLFSFSYCPPGVKSYQNTTWDTTLGWLLGFHAYTVYYLSANKTSGTTIIAMTGETFVDTNLYKNVLICLDDFNQNHLNDGLVTISPKDSNIPLPSYANLYNFQCDPATKQRIYDSTAVTEYKKLTQVQTYSIAQIINSQTANVLTPNTPPTVKNPGKSYGFGPYVTDVFANVPLKLTGLVPGQSYVEYGGTLQDQNRYYFGPVNIHRMSVKLVTDRGNVLDLNGSNWSIGLICEQLNNLNTGATKK